MGNINITTDDEVNHLEVVGQGVSELPRLQ